MLYRGPVAREGGVMVRRMDLQSLEDRLTEGFLIGAVVASIVLNIVGLDPKWYLPAIFLALYGIFRMVATQYKQSAVTSAFYPNTSEFYASMQRRMQSAQSYIWATYVRLVPPPGFNSAEANSYFQYGLDWARRNPDREFGRIVAAPAGNEMRTWLLQHHADTKSINNYLVRVVPYVGRIDGINMAVIDDKIVFLALSGEGQRMTGHSIETSGLVQAFKEYYITWWDVAEPLESFVSRITSARAVGGNVESELN
jgi:hypothetical protein